MLFTDRELSLLNNTNVLGYVQAANAERNAQAKAEGWEFWTLMPEDADFLAQFKNVYELEHSYACGTYSDVYKEDCGFRPSHNYRYLTLEQLEAEISKMSKDIAEAIEEERKWLAEQKQMERDAIMLGLTDTGECGEEVQLEQWEIYEAKAEAAGY
jgi:hypothetical protein